MRKKNNMSKTIALISLSMDGGYIKNKEVLLVDGFPLYYYAAIAAKESHVFENIYLLVNRSEVSKMAQLLEINEFTNNFDSSNEELVNDFIKANKCKHLVHLNASAALIKPDTIAQFTNRLINSNHQKLIGTNEEFCNQSNYIICGYSFPKLDDKIDYFPISKLESLVATSMSDLFIVEACLRHLKRKDNVGRHVFTNRIKLIDGNVIKVMKDDSVGFYTREYANKSFHKFDEIIKKMGKGSWCYQIIYNTDDQIGLICQQPNEGVRYHAHVTKDEWWVVIQGTFEWRLDDNKVITASKGELVYLPQGTVHSIVCTSKESGVRLACGARDFEHIYV